MEEIEEWFLNEFGHLGFSVTPTLYNPDTFEPHKGVLFGGRNVGINLITEYVIDLDVKTEYKNMITQLICGFLEEYTTIDFKPIKKNIKFKL
jgi:hypothetical protein